MTDLRIGIDCDRHCMPQLSRTAPPPSIITSMDGVKNNALMHPNILGDRDQLGQQLALLSASMDAVKACINALAPISCLPHEVLAVVFSLLLDDERTYWSAVPSDLSKRRPRALRLGWIRVTHVCRTWRHVALDFRALWRDITFSLGSRWAQCMFARARNAPVSIRAHLGSPLYALEDALRIDAHLSHTHSITLSASKTCLPFCLQRLVSPAPFLRTLCLTVDHSGLGPEAVVTAPADLFSGSTPNLCCISLRNVFIPWTSSLFANLSSLSIVLPVLSKAVGEYFWDPPKPVDDNGWTPVLAPFLEALNRMAGLESLTIHGALPYYEETMVFASEQVNLPRLKSLDLGGTVEDITSLLHLVHFSRAVDLRLLGHFLDDPTSSSSELFAVLSACLRSPQDSGLPLTDLRIDCFRGLRITGSVKHKAERSTILDIRLAEEDYKDILSEFLPGVQLDVLASLEIGDVELGELAWYAGLPGSHKAAIRALTANAPSLHDLCKFLGRRDGSSGAVPLPHLSCLTVRRLPRETLKLTRTQLTEVLQLRKQSGVVLQKLILDSCVPSAVPSSWVDTLRTIVPEVVVQNEQCHLEDFYDWSRPSMFG